MGTLARSLHVSMPTVSGIVDRLVRAGFLRRLPRTDDRRQVVVELTPKAAGFFHAFQRVVRRRWEEVLIALDQDQLEAFHHVLTTLRDRLQADVR